jgi:SAM-dependent methyltransferase
MAVERAAFEKMFEASDDPWAFRTRWYEQRKRQLTLASLPAQRFARGYEPGCANGELSAALATRCDRLLVSDAAAGAVALARRRLASLPHVEVTHAAAPAEWPEGRFDLVVLSELGYYLPEALLQRLACNARRSLTDSGVFLACHWRAPIVGCELSGDEVHRVLDAALAMHRLAHHTEADFVMDVWAMDLRSVAQREAFG